ncbi:MAG: hypothetical protein U0136_18450 [Bdellovibrionota bacterium]
MPENSSDHAISDEDRISVASHFIRPIPILLGETAARYSLSLLIEHLLETSSHDPRAQKSDSFEQLAAELKRRFFDPFRGQPAYTFHTGEPLTAEQLGIARELLLVDELAPSPERYDAVVVFGGLFSASQAQLSYLCGAAPSLKSGAPIFVLCSERRLLPVELWQIKERRGPSSLNSRPRNEIDMLKLLWSDLDSTSPALHESGENVVFVCAPNIKVENGPTARNAGTRETIRQLLSEHPQTTGCSILAVSSQPYLRYQTVALVRSLLEAGVRPKHVHGCGPAAPAEGLTVNAFGNMLTKLIFEERRLSEQLGSASAPPRPS